MLGDELFPRDFIYALEAPSNYIGASRIFGPDAQGEVLRYIEDAEEEFPAKHRSDLQVMTLPESLIEALRCFLLSCAIRDLRGEGATHRSMLVNVSRFTAVQNQVADIIYTSLTAIQQDVRSYGSLSVSEASCSPILHSLKETFDREFIQTGLGWEQVQAALHESIASVVVKAVNQQTRASSLDYALHRQNGLRVVTVGGNSLSRGLTLNGLSVSYFYRNSQMYDTLLQMGRWFGYRQGYDCGGR